MVVRTLISKEWCDHCNRTFHVLIITRHSQNNMNPLLQASIYEKEQFVLKFFIKFVNQCL